jgi:hypothetical protein
VLGAITIGRIARGTDETQAGIQLIGDTGVRMLLTLWVDPADGLISGMLIEPDRTAATPSATAVASAVASPAASPVAAVQAPSMDQVLPAYENARDRLLAQGRTLMEALLGGDEEAVESLIAADTLAQLGENFVSEYVVFLERIQLNIVHMELPEFGAIFDGQVSEGRIRGFFHQGGPGSFDLVADEPQPDEVPRGRWTGQIGPGGGQLDIEVTFSGAAEALEASISIPSQELLDLPLANVSFEPERPIGELRQERALPLGQATDNYSWSAAYAWGESELVITASFNEEGLATGLNTVASPPLPPDPAAGVMPGAEYRLPFAGAWIVVWGGNTEFQNYHARTPVTRHAYDVMIWKDGATYAGDGARNEQYHAWGQPALAPAGGTVVEVMDGLADLEPGLISDPARAAGIDPTMHPAGNHVMIQTGDDEYLLIAHLQRGTVRVAQGDRVRTGDVLGLVGSSGNSSEPHIHIHLQDQADFLEPTAIGLPLVFTNYVANGAPVESGQPEQGDLIAPAD